MEEKMLKRSKSKKESNKSLSHKMSRTRTLHEGLKKEV